MSTLTRKLGSLRGKRLAFLPSSSVWTTIKAYILMFNFTHLFSGITTPISQNQSFLLKMGMRLVMMKG
jgi:hypothetical protein